MTTSTAASRPFSFLAWADQDLVLAARDVAADIPAALSLAIDLSPLSSHLGTSTWSYLQSLGSLGAGDLTVARVVEPHLDEVDPLPSPGEGLGLGSDVGGVADVRRQVGQLACEAHAFGNGGGLLQRGVCLVARGEERRVARLGAVGEVEVPRALAQRAHVGGIVGGDLARRLDGQRRLEFQVLALAEDLRPRFQTIVEIELHRSLIPKLMGRFKELAAGRRRRLPADV